MEMSDGSRLARLKDEAAVLAVWGLFTLVASGIGFVQSRAAVAVRPRLADVGFWTALFTNHGHDWLFYHEPVLAVGLTAVVGFIGSVVVVKGVFGL